MITRASSASRGPSVTYRSAAPGAPRTKAFPLLTTIVVRNLYRL
jgi:hypothetical protein